MATSTGVVNEAFIYIGVFSVLLFAGIVFCLVYFTVRFRSSRNPIPTEIPGKPWLEIVWVILPTLLALSFFFYGLTGFQFLRNAPADSMKVMVHSRQWSWLFEYENGIRSPDLVVPDDRNVRLELTSDDVLHGFYVPAFHIQVDTVPGMTTRAWFRAQGTGSYDILCTQYCGVQHSAMLAHVRVVSQDQFAGWYAGLGAGGAAGLADLPASAPTGADLLRQRGCLACHSIDGSRMTGPTLKGLFGATVKVVTAGRIRELVADEDYLRRSIVQPGADVVEGYQNVMPASGGSLNDAEIDQIVRFLKDVK
jgi:cytochrome c oxidase subunit 2